MSVLQRQMDLGGERDYIDGTPVHAGEFIRAFINGEWINGRYEAQWRGGVIVHATFYFRRNGREVAHFLDGNNTRVELAP